MIEMMKHMVMGCHGEHAMILAALPVIPATMLWIRAKCWKPKHKECDECK